MKFKQLCHVFLFVLLFIGVVIYIAYAMLEFRGGNPHEVCTDVHIEIEGDTVRSFLTAEQIQEMLQNADAYPKGKPMKDVDTRKIEDALKHNTFIEHVECYKVPTPSDNIDHGRICIKVALRRPVIFILPDNTEGYYVDDQGMVIPNSAYARNIITATGRITRRFATEELSTFGAYLRDNPFWDQMIEQIYVSKDTDGQPTVTLVPRIGDQTIYLGALTGYEKKLRRLHIFYQKGIPEFGWNKYHQLNLEYDNQIVCTK